MTVCAWFVCLIPGRARVPCKASVALGALPIREGRQTEDDSPFQYMSGIYLVLAGLCEIGWPLGFKLSQAPGTGSGRFAACIAFSVFSMALSGFLLWLAQRSIPIGTA